MSKKVKIQTEEKIQIAKDFLSGNLSQSEFEKKYAMNRQSLYDWVHLYESQGVEGFLSREKNESYTAEFKLQVVKEYLEGQLSQRKICKKYGISSHSMVRRWIKSYNGQKGFWNPNGGRRLYMTKGRVTTLAERIVIVSDCIANGKDYGSTMERHRVSYQQIYNWVRKYEESGTVGLIDKRGRNKLLDEMTETERLQAEVKLLKAENERKNMEIALLKKVQELERGRD